MGGVAQRRSTCTHCQRQKVPNTKAQGVEWGRGRGGETAGRRERWEGGALMAKDFVWACEGNETEPSKPVSPTAHNPMLATAGVPAD